MDSSARKKDTQSAWFDIAVFAVVAAFFLFSAHSLTRSQARPPLPQATTARPPVDRQIASTQHAAITPPAEDQSVQIFRLDCLFGTNLAATRFSTRAGMVRIVANLCHGKNPLAKNVAFSGKNASSGEDIVPFVQEGKSMSTNYFSLREGSNKISFQLALSQGKNLAREIEVVREPKAD